uniref:Protein-lysine N-methyltransferase n=1 Tax=Hirondellea gigas TaxID=1518452 RepID=A0A2P2I5T0_9CRUS
MAEVEELPSSELGTKEHWDSTYDYELRGFRSRGDCGEIWFGEESEDRVLDWLTEEYQPPLREIPPTGLSKETQDPGTAAPSVQSCSVLDLGTGNGHFLAHLSAFGFTDLYGVDYSLSSITLAKAVAADKAHNITYAQLDLVVSKLPDHPLAQRQYHVCHDKGTYDAVSLTPDVSRQSRTYYIDNLCRLLEDDGIFIITSCNWTEDELVQHFQHCLEKVHTIPTPTFQFGGKTGSLVTSLVLKKIKQQQPK